MGENTGSCTMEDPAREVEAALPAANCTIDPPREVEATPGPPTPIIIPRGNSPPVPPDPPPTREVALAPFPEAEVQEKGRAEVAEEEEEEAE